MDLCGGKMTTNHLSQGMTTNFNTNLDFTNILKVKVRQKDRIITEVMVAYGLLKIIRHNETTTQPIHFFLHKVALPSYQ
jgi:hypothetical protein